MAPISTQTMATHLGDEDQTIHFVAQDDLRSAFALAMSAMYKDEVPLYGDLVQIVREVNQAVEKETIAASKRAGGGSYPFNHANERLDLERHGAIRLGLPQELRQIRRVFALIGLYPVGYYDLSVADLPMHATAFRPVSQHSLARNPFRVFTTLLRAELLEPRGRELALSLINRRKLFTDKLLDLVEIGETQGGFTDLQSSTFIQEALKTFRWEHSAASSFAEYQTLKSEHAILADISCFGTAHINHLTPRTLDIDRAYALMKHRGLEVKDSIEGPPRRSVPVLLRQTSFLALEERTHFHTDTTTAPTSHHAAVAESSMISSTHKARFGEIEQRGAALTARGRALYDSLVAEGCDDTSTWAITFNSRIPDDWNELLSKGLVYCIYRVKSDGNRSEPNKTEGHTPVSVSTTQLLHDGILEAVPQPYEDFLPFSAAGIFRSNLSTDSDSAASSSPSSSSSASAVGTKETKATPQQNHQHSSSSVTVNWSFPDQDGLEDALGCKVIDPYQWYAKTQQDSLRLCSEVLGLDIREG